MTQTKQKKCDLIGCELYLLYNTKIDAYFNGSKYYYYDSKYWIKFPIKKENNRYLSWMNRVSMLSTTREWYTILRWIATQTKRATHQTMPTYRYCKFRQWDGQLYKYDLLPQRLKDATSIIADDEAWDIVLRDVELWVLKPDEGQMYLCDITNGFPKNVSRLSA